VVGCVFSVHVSTRPRSREKYLTHTTSVASVLRRRRMSSSRRRCRWRCVLRNSIVVLQGCVVGEEDAEGVEGVGGAGERAGAGDRELDARAVGGGGGVSGGGVGGGVGRCS
jgi:hypothetical protein